MYLFDNELFAIECIAKYAMEGLDVKKGGIHNGRRDEFAHCPEPSSKGDWGYYLTFNDHQHQGLLQSKDMDCKCFIPYKTKLWLDTYPPNYFELYDIYTKFNKHTEETKKKISKSKSGVPKSKEWKKTHSERMSGKKHPNYGNTGALSSCSKAIIAIKPDGTKLHFGGVHEAARKLGIDQGKLSGHLTTKKQPKWGKWEGWQFFYAVKE